MIGGIAILLTLLLGVIGKGAQSARSIRCIDNLKNLYTATITYMADHQQAFPVHSLRTGAGINCWYMPLINMPDYAVTGPKKDYDRIYLRHPGYASFRRPFHCTENKAKTGAAYGWTNYAINSNLVGVRATNVTGIKVLYLDSYDHATESTSYFSRGHLNHNGKLWNYTSPVHGDHLNAIFTDGHARSIAVSPPGPSQGQDLRDLRADWF